MRALPVIALLAGLPTGGLACSPAIREPSPVPVQGPNCAYGFDLDEIDGVSLGEAARAPSGLLVQALRDGNGCYSRLNLVVHDCAAGQVMVIGTEHFDLMQAMERGPAHNPPIEAIRDGAISGELATLADLAAASAAQGYGTPLVLRTDQSLRYDRQTLPLSCACRTARGGG